MHLGRLPRLPLTVSEKTKLDGHQGRNPDQLTYCSLARDRQINAYDLVREQNTINASHVARANPALDHLMYKRPDWSVGNWMWLYNSHSTIHQGANKTRDSPILKHKLALEWMGPFTILAVGPSASSPDNHPVGAKLLYWELSTNLRGRDVKLRVSIARCKPRLNPRDDREMPTTYRRAWSSASSASSQ